MRNPSACPGAVRSHARPRGQQTHHATCIGIHTEKAAHGSRPGRLFSSPSGTAWMPGGDTAASIAGSPGIGWLPHPDASASHSLFRVVPCPTHFVKGGDSHSWRNWFTWVGRRGHVARGGAV